MEQLSGIQFKVAATLPEEHRNMENPQKRTGYKSRKSSFFITNSKHAQLHIMRAALHE
jgi:hypothetical protein